MSYVQTESSIGEDVKLGQGPLSRAELFKRIIHDLSIPGPTYATFARQESNAWLSGSGRHRNRRAADLQLGRSRFLRRLDTTDTALARTAGRSRILLSPSGQGQGRPDKNRRSTSPPTTPHKHSSAIMQRIGMDIKAPMGGATAMAISVNTFEL
jgi:hypothetical protein